MYQNRERRHFAPVKVGDELDVKIEAVGEKGDGIAKIKGFVLFVPNSQKDQECRIRITRVVRKVGFAEILGPAQGPVVVDEKPAQKQEQNSSDSEEPQEQSEESMDEQEEEQY